MTLLVIAVGLLFGYWGVSAFLERHDLPPSLPDTLEGEAWYTVLGVSESASTDDITAAYRSAMNQYHPDKVAHLGVELQAVASKKSQQINTAYEYAMHIRGRHKLDAS